MEDMKRTLKTMPNFKTNSPRDFFHLDYSLSCFFPETQEKIEGTVNEMYSKIGKILDDDREKAGQIGSGMSAGQGQPCRFQD